MKILIKYIFILIFIIYQNGYSQDCDGGIVTLNIYTLNGTNFGDAYYEIYPASKELVNKYRDLSNKPFNFGTIINNIEDNEIQQNENLNPKLDELLKFSSISKSGKFKTSLEFKITEIYYPIIVKIIFEGKSTFIIGNYFGGCNRHIHLIWNGYYLNVI